MPQPNLPVDLVKGDVTRTASTATDYWNLVADGFVVDSEESDSPQKKAAATRRRNREAAEGDQTEEQETSHDGPEKTVGTNQS